MYIRSSSAAYNALHSSQKHIWSLPAPDTFPERVEPPFGGARIFGLDVCSGLHFTPRFSLTRDAKVFTIGSCFARNVEEALLAQGFNVLTRLADFGFSHGYLNRYNTGAMTQEIEFAIGSKRFDERSISSMEVDGFADLTSYGRFGTPVKHSDSGVKQQTSSSGIASADFIIITAGLSEVWYDKDYDYYTNIAPSRAALVYPDRFEFRLLSYTDNYNQLRHLVEMIREIRPSCKIVMTVSPVPLNATFVDRDVLISNSYSKACLRAAVEQIHWECNALTTFQASKWSTFPTRRACGKPTIDTSNSRS